MNYKKIPELELKRISPNIKTKAAEFFSIICDGKIRRKSQRQKRIYAALYEAYTFYNIKVTPSYVQNIMGCDNNIKNGGIVIYSERTGNEITALDLIYEMVENLGYGEIDYCLITNIYNLANNKAKIIDRSEPKSVAAGLLYYYYMTAGVKINKKIFSNETGSSVSTICGIYNNLIDVL